ncbi:protein of unknown function [Lishizhenia tianjinensis]|uniref:DUF4374 domain-containing protein n=1 Tax=Lishizhenia tianjinensis TaxID=477690 RepID=A0A1I6Y8E3_9FLAO|nr:DUF4374 domain-containing protein [Lishizhenia tianjinensis]SFT46789.1 protein of unknown function [Lishizhenia tianjinensis]
MKNAIKIGALSLLTVSMVACKKEDPKDNVDNNANASGYVVGLRSADGTADFIVSTQSVTEGNISSTGMGVEQTGWCYFAATNDTYFAFNYTENFATAYDVQNGMFTEKGQFIFERVDLMEYDAESDVLFGIGAPWGGGAFDCNFQIIDPTSVSITSSNTQTIYAPMHNGTQINVWPNDILLKNGKAYIPFYPLVGDTWETPITDTAYVAIYSYPDMTLQKIIKDARSTPIGYYGNQPVIMEAENGDIYALTTASYAAGYTQVDNPSGVLKIDGATDEFDASFFMNVEDDHGYRVMTGEYAGNGKIVARVIEVATDDASGVGSWAGFTTENPICKIAIIDVDNETFEIVNDIPLHGGQYKTPFFKENGKVMVSINDGTSAAVYAVDASTATATKGATIGGGQLQGIFKY